MMEFRHNLQSIDRVAEALMRSPDVMHRHAEGALDRGAHETARLEKEFAPKAFSTLTNAIHVRRTRPLRRVIVAAVGYSDAVEGGTGIFGPEGIPSGKMPPVQSLLDWIKVKRIEPNDPRMTQEDLAFVIGRSIAASGTPPQPFAAPALEHMEPRLLDLVAMSMERGMQEVLA